MQHIVVVGNGVAGLTAGDTLRRLGFAGELTVVGQETYATYSRPALSKTALDPAEEFTVNYLPEATHEGTELLGRSAVQLDARAQTVALDDDSELSYDGLVIASGTSARRFTDSGAEYTVRSIDDVTALRERLRSRPTVVVVGGGPLGMELASGAINMGCDVTLVHRGVPMTQHVGPLLAEILTQVGIEHGLQLVDDYVTEVQETDTGMAVHLESGRALTSDVVISATGDEPNIQWLTGSGLLTDERLLIDQYCRVNDTIVAAGDVAHLRTPQGVQRNPIWTTAIEQAKTAAASLVTPQTAKPLDFQSYFWTDQWGMNVKISGPIPATDEPPVVVKGSLEERSAVLHWPRIGSAAAFNIRMPIPRLHKLARETLALS